MTHAELVRKVLRDPVHWPAFGFGAGRAGDGSKEIERIFSPEFRNRLDEIVHFGELGEEVMGRVVDKFVAEVEGKKRNPKPSSPSKSSSTSSSASRMPR